MITYLLVCMCLQLPAETLTTIPNRESVVRALIPFCQVTGEVMHCIADSYEVYKMVYNSG